MQINLTIFILLKGFSLFLFDLICHLQEASLNASQTPKFSHTSSLIPNYGIRVVGTSCAGVSSNLERAVLASLGSEPATSSWLSLLASIGSRYSGSPCKSSTISYINLVFSSFWLRKRVCNNRIASLLFKFNVYACHHLQLTK